MVAPYLAETPDYLMSRLRLRSTSTSTLLVPLTQWRALRDRAFPLAAAQAWNARTSLRNLEFRQELKTENAGLFKASFVGDVSWQTRSCRVCTYCIALTADVLNYFQYCDSIFYKSITLIIWIYNNNNNNNNSNKYLLNNRKGLVLQNILAPAIRIVINSWEQLNLE